MLLGKPLISEPAKKSYPEIFSYGALQIYFRDIVVEGFSFDLQKCQYYENFVSLESLDKKDLVNFMIRNNIFFVKDELLSSESNELLITDKGVNLGFVNNTLVTFGF